ncbi:DUF6381 family protein [Streptomyces sp. NPDC090052]|uniref:DUF6381 family protein n=1 Tax=unclassified Streptomyces TaxID=2593676 RepID=UPI0022512920|nr:MULTISPECIES: DUF6381 family protein [unclassified Streptomyces]MCX4722395.1 DUF6381 family protein [Streptomyces sp. NBC_01306]WSV07949.1 DUF6381 family protein [Streptomyces sp. NBC_01020]WSX46037.1 DUF6381 family protein [Streptomyces sp. NBC_00963]WSX65893.1 DUF6381 family protein [Streptomyces sp. NBC_00932]
MSGVGESGKRIQQMRAKAQDLKQAAERTTDPEERRRLKDKASRLDRQSEQESGMAAGDIYPSE